ncbi:MAG: hypothetical protein J2P36_30945, partial [Ktedonobacteraceae bacterium]|nr:hypothetical protein [Ktedonobacteraceae bacterium]
VMAVAHGAGPSSPLYALKNWEQRVEYSLNDPAVAQARLDDQAARDHLSMLANLTDAAHAGAYRDTLKAFNQYLAAFTQDVQALPASNDKDQLQQELVALKSDARHTLRGLLQRLALTEQISTCATLLDLGETMPYLTSVTALLTGHGKVQVTISGEYLQPGARLVVDNQLMTVTGVLQRGKYVFTLNWSGKQQPTLLGIRNPDGTVALSSHFTWKGAPGGSAGNQGGGGNGNGNGNGHGNGNGGGGGKPQDGE